MYDPKSEAHEFIADSREDAVEKATGYFGVDAEELRVEVLDDVAGLAGRVLAVAQPKAAVGRARPSRPAREDGEERGRGRGGRGRDRDREGRGDRERGGRGRRGPRESREEREPRGEAGEAKAAPAPSEPSKGSPRGEIGSLGDFLLGLLERMDLGPFELARIDEERHTVFEVRGEAAQTISSGEPRTVEAIQLLVNQVAARADEDARRVVVDMEGDRARRESYLARLADRAARRAADTGRTVALDPMNGKDRREVHMALRDTDGIATMSIGEGRYRQVLVVPEGAPEYDDAIEAARAAASAE